MTSTDPGDILDTLDPLTNSSTLEHVAQVVRCSVALIVQGSVVLDEQWLSTRATRWALEASTMSDGLRAMVRACVEAEVRRVVRRATQGVAA